MIGVGLIGGYIAIGWLVGDWRIGLGGKGHLGCFGTGCLFVGGQLGDGLDENREERYPRKQKSQKKTQKRKTDKTKQKN